MTPVQILKAARAKIEKPEDWGQGDSVRRGCPIGHTFCSLEAIYSCQKSGDAVAAEVILRGVIGRKDVLSWNDASERTHAEVLEAFDRAIALAEAQP